LPVVTVTRTTHEPDFKARTREPTTTH
jgi:hypothetical protein